MIYMDNVAGTKPDERVVEKMIPYLREFYGNPSAHFYPLGRESFEAVAAARSEVAGLIGAADDEVVFTSCGTESNNLALKGVLFHPSNQKKMHIVMSEIEHFSVQNTAAKLISQGFEITKVRVTDGGLVDPDEVKKAIRPDTALVSVMHANPEIGTVQDIVAVGEAVKDTGAVFHVDAVATAGHLPVNVDTFNADLLTIAGQNFYGPRGSAALYIRKGTKVQSLLDGGAQEHGYRSGSENVPAIVGIGEAARIARAEMGEYAPRMQALGNKLWSGIGSMYDFVHFTGNRDKRLPGHVSFWVEYIEGESLLMWFSLKDVAAASGSACSSNILAEDEEDLAASHVLTAVGVPNDICAGSLTFSMSKYNTEADVDHVLSVAPEIIDRLCEMSPAFQQEKK